jgi:precorrin-6B methylase 2
MRRLSGWLLVVFFAAFCASPVMVAAAEGTEAPPKPAKKVKVKKATDEAAKEGEKAPTRKPDVVFVPTPQDVVEKMLEMCAVQKTDLLYDLGCGDGRIVVTAAKKYGCKAIGFDIDPKRIEESKQNVEKNEMGKLVKIEHKDIFTLDLSKANVVTLYLLPSLNVKLIPQLEKLKPGARIVSHDFDMEGVEPEQEVKFTSKIDNRQHTIYFWKAPIKKEGEKEKEKEKAKGEKD